DRDFRFETARAVALIASAILATGVGTGSLSVAGVGLVLLALWLIAVRRRHTGYLDIATLVCVFAVGASPFLYPPLRARHDPAVNQGNPATLRGVIEVIARRQYDVPGLYPRRAPLWLQIGNLFQYVDWQFALGL